MDYEALTRAEIDLGAIKKNVRRLRDLLGDETKLMAVVKADAYGHGALQVARAALEEGVKRLAVHRVIEGLRLREEDIKVPVLLLGYAPPSVADQVVENDLTPTIMNRKQAEALQKAAKSYDRIIPVHLCVDTGMGRSGIKPEEVLQLVEKIDEFSHLELEGIYTHFATADEIDKSYTYYQYWRYKQVLEELKESGFSVPSKHVCNSAATLDFPDLHEDMVRCGILLYGLYPSEEVNKKIDLEPALFLKSQVIRVCTLPKGSSIGYGRTYTTDKPTRVALVPTGYGDGYHRITSNRSEVLINGCRVPTVGAVSMDQVVVNVDELEGVDVGDEAVLIGEQGDETISAEEVAGWAETINYEVVTSLLPRVTRIYIRDGEVVDYSSMTDKLDL